MCKRFGSVRVVDKAGTTIQQRQHRIPSALRTVSTTVGDHVGIRVFFFFESAPRLVDCFDTLPIQNRRICLFVLPSLCASSKHYYYCICTRTRTCTAPTWCITNTLSYSLWRLSNPYWKLIHPIIYTSFYCLQ
jgi:hypothetical protein